MSDTRILRGYQSVQDLTGKSRTQIWRNVRDGSFPAPIELGPNSVGWYEEEVLAWLNERPRRIYTTARVEVDADARVTHAASDFAKWLTRYRRQVMNETNNQLPETSDAVDGRRRASDVGS